MIRAEITLDKAGIYQLPADVYHADPCPAPSLSSTLAKTMIAQSPLHAWDKSPLLNPNYEPTDSKTFDIGRAAHRAVLGKGEGYVAIPSDMLSSNGAASTKAAKEFIEEARASGLTPLKADEVDQIGTIADKVRAKLDRMGIDFDPAHSEVTAIAQIDGVWCRAMIDNAPADPRQPLYDLKTCENATIGAITRSVSKCGYAIQAQHYLRTWKAATGEDRDFCFVFVEKSSPNEVAVVRLYNDGEGRIAKDYQSDEPFSGDWFADAEHDLAEARKTWRACLDAGEWPGYPDRVALIGAPIFHRRECADRQFAGIPQPKSKPSAEALKAAREMQKPEGETK